MNLVAESQVAESLEITTKAVRLRSAKGNWPVKKQRKQGGSERFFIRDLLPVNIQQSLVARDTVEGNAGLPAVLHDRPVPKRSKEIGLAKYNLVHAFRLRKENAAWGKKAEEANDFLLAYNAGVLMPSVFEAVGKIKEKTLDALDKRLRDHDDNYLCLCDGRGGWRKHGTNKYKGRQMSEQAKSIFLKCYLMPERPTVMTAIRSTLMTMAKAGLEERPSESTFRRWLKDFKAHNAHVVCLAREGMKAYSDQYGPYGTRDASLLKVGQVLVADGKTLNFFILHPVTGRPCRMKLIVFLDWASRYPVGWQIMPEENSMAILSAFRNAVETLGKYPECVYLDNGKAFKAKVFTETDPDLESMTGLYARMGTAVTFAKPYNGRAKVVERWFKTVQEQVEFMMPSYCGDSILTKPAWMHRNEKFHKAWHEARTNNWIPTIQEAAHILNAYFQWYGRQPHDSLNGTPEEVFLPGRGPGVDPIQLNYDFLWHTTAIPHNCRVNLWKIEYEADCLANLEKGKEIVIRYDTADLRKIWCYTRDNVYIGEASPVRALHPMARLFGDEVSLAQVQDHNKRLARHKKNAVRHLEALGISKNCRSGLEVLPFAQKAAILPPSEKPVRKDSSPAELPEKEIKRLGQIADQALAEADPDPGVDRPKLWHSEIERYEWCWRLKHEHKQTPEPEDISFMASFESRPEFELYRQRFEDWKLIL